MQRYRQPEPAKHLSGHVWSRRISEVDRLVDEVVAEHIVFLQARDHY